MSAHERASSNKPGGDAGLHRAACFRGGTRERFAFRGTGVPPVNRRVAAKASRLPLRIKFVPERVTVSHRGAESAKKPAHESLTASATGRACGGTRERFGFLIPAPCYSPTFAFRFVAPRHWTVRLARCSAIGPADSTLAGARRLSSVSPLMPASLSPISEFNVRDYGAKGDGVALDSPAINAAIEAATKAGGGTVRLPAGVYLSFTIRLASNLTLHLDAGATLLAATPSPALGGYDEPEPNDWGDLYQYQDFGHSHWRNSLIRGENLENVAITGTGRIDGRGLVKNLAYSGGPRDCGPDGTVNSGTRPRIMFAPDPVPAGTPAPPLDERAFATDGQGNKAIGLKCCRNVTLRDFSILNGGHFALLATGVDNLTIDGLRIDTNRDGLDIDACRNVRIINCSVNAPNDDAIVLKSGYALGEARACENVTIVNCFVSGFDLGSMLDATYRRTGKHAPDLDGPTGRIKLGTESSGGFRNIAIVNCVFEHSRGLALETVDGGVIEDVVVSNLAMRDITSSPIFIRLGNRARGPKGTPVASIRRVKISQVSVSGADGRFPILIAGLSGHAIEDVTLDNIDVLSRGGITLDQVAQQPAELVNSFFLRGDEPGVTGPRDPFAVPQREKSYPEPSMFGLLPASALYARHVKNLVVRNVNYAFERDDTRPRVVLEHVNDASFDRFRLPAAAAGVEPVVLREVSGFKSTE